MYAKDKNGFIDVETIHGKGTILKVYMPVVEAAVLPTEHSDISSAAGRGEEILIKIQEVLDK